MKFSWLLQKYPADDSRRVFEVTQINRDILDTRMIPLHLPTVQKIAASLSMKQIYRKIPLLIYT
jgi:hypothetical protein